MAGRWCKACAGSTVILCRQREVPMLKASYLIALLGVLFVVGGCPGGDDDDTGGDACPPGETQTCTCDGGESGSQVCAPGGGGWGACDCGTGDDDDSAGG